MSERDELAEAIEQADINAGMGEGGAVHWESMAGQILAAGYRKPRTVTTVEELDALPVESVVRSDMGNVYVKDYDLDNPEDSWWAIVGSSMQYKNNRILTPATVLHEPEPQS